MPNCLGDDKWSSNVPGNASKERGRFEITTEQPNGDFVGVFTHLPSLNTEDITGNCSAGSIWFDKPANHPTHRYSATFIYENGEKKRFEGHRNPHHEIFRAEGDTKALTGDDWTGTKGT